MAKRINDDVAQINTNLDGTLAVANAIKADTGNILAEAKAAERYAALHRRADSAARPALRPNEGS